MIIATDSAQVRISTMSGKLEGLQAINTNTLSNSFCSLMRQTDAICSACYSAANCGAFCGFYFLVFCSEGS